MASRHASISFVGPNLVALVVLCVACFGATGVIAQGLPSSSGIYTCVDGKGRKITSDRPIAECTDRSQNIITPSGTVKKVVGPTLTAREQTALEEQEKLAAERRAQALEDKRRDRALLTRYPNSAAHDQERAIALDQVDQVIKTSAVRSRELLTQREQMLLEMEFYKKDPSKAPGSLKRKMDENSANMAEQKRFVLEKEEEKKRINTRFDQEGIKLKQLWLLASGAAPSAPTAPAPSSN
jgi:hypothetical protein